MRQWKNFCYAKTNKDELECLSKQNKITITDGFITFLDTITLNKNTIYHTYLHSLFKRKGDLKL